MLAEFETDLPSPTAVAFNSLFKDCFNHAALELARISGEINTA
jgi:hypothetical protein